MKNFDSAVLFTFGLFAAFCVVVIGLWVFQSSIERDVWNKCHPDLQLTTWETMWSTTRIDNCG
jgi:hypothetical protein